MKILSTDKAPAAIGPYSQGVWHGDLLFLSGQIPIDPATQGVVAGEIEAQTRRVLDNIGAVLAEAGLTFGHVIKTTVFLDDLADFKRFNEVYALYFREHKPARSTVQAAALPRAVKVEIEVIAGR